MRRLVVVLVALGTLVVPGSAVAALTLTGPPNSTTLRTNQTVTISWSSDGDGTANDILPSYLLLGGASGQQTWIYLKAAGVAAHTLSFRPDTTGLALKNSNPTLVDSVTTPVPGGVVLPPDTYSIELFIEPFPSGTQLHASRGPLVIQGQCEPGTYSSDGWPTCTAASPGHYVTASGATSQLECPPGTFAGNSATVFCLQAPPGSSIALSAATAPVNCGLGTYQDEPGQTSCKTAPANTFVAVEGATSATPCPAGTTSPAASTSSSACVGPAGSDTRTDTATTSTATTRACSVARGRVVTAACAAAQAGVDLTQAKDETLRLAKGSPGTCRVRRGRIVGTAAGTCRVVLVVTPKSGRVTRTPVAVTITAR